MTFLMVIAGLIYGRFFAASVELIDRELKHAGELPCARIHRRK